MYFTGSKGPSERDRQRFRKLLERLKDQYAEPKLAIPNKGELFEPTAELLKDFGLNLVDLKASRKLSAQLQGAEWAKIKVFLMNVFDIPMAVVGGFTQGGLTGGDAKDEDFGKLMTQIPTENLSEFEAKKFLDLLTDIKNESLDFGGCRLVLATDQNKAKKFRFYERVGGSAYGETRSFTTLSYDFGPDGRLRIATRYPQLAMGYTRLWITRDDLVRISILPLNGSVESSIALGMADAIVDLVASGKTLEANGLVPVADIASYSAVLMWKERWTNMYQESLSSNCDTPGQYRH